MKIFEGGQFYFPTLYLRNTEISWFASSQIFGMNNDTDGCRSLTTLLVKYYNDLLDRQSSGRGRDEVTYFYVGDVFCIYLGTMYANFQEKIFAEISGKKFQTFDVSNVYPQHRSKYVTSSLPRPESRTLSIKQVIVVLY